MNFPKRVKALLNFKGTSHELALSFAIGVALGIIPGTGAMAAAAVAAILGMNLPLMVAGALVTNPITTPFVYLGSYLLGSWLLGEWLPAGRVARIILGTLVGNLILALGLAVIGYGAIFGLVSALKFHRGTNTEKISRPTT